MVLERKEFVPIEVQKLLDANIIKGVHYSDWVSNIVLVTKENGQWHPLC